MPKKKTNIRTRILLAFTILLLFSFSLIGIIFNIAAMRYIKNNAISQLDSAHIALQTMEQWQTEMPQRISPVPNRVNIFRIQANMFPVDEWGNSFPGFGFSDETTEITDALVSAHAKIIDIRNQRIRTDSGIYYVSTFHMTETQMDMDVYWVVYADVTGLSHFANTVNLFLIFLVCVMFVITNFVAFFLSSSITYPINKLSSLATHIGQGNFTPDDFKFSDVEFENLNMTLNKTAKQLCIYDSEQKAFFQNVSHELRTPLMSIKCYAEGIAVGLMEPKQASETILEETDRLTEMVTDLLYVSKVDNITSSYAKVTIDLLDIIRTCAEHQKAIAETRQLRFIFDFKDTHVYYHCIDEMITRAVNNLIANAIRYAASEIILSCHKNANAIIIRVSDDGIGIETESVPHVFERFYKGKDGNNGIGLSLVKSIAEQHNGNVTAENSYKNGGAVFTMTLPIIHGGKR